MTGLPKRKFCSMCGAIDGDRWETSLKKVILSVKPHPNDILHSWTICDECDGGLQNLFAKGINPFRSSYPIYQTIGHIKDKSKGGDDSPGNLRALCTNCNEGLQNINLPTPDRIHLLSQVRRATIDDQRALLDWLLRKFNLTAIRKI